MLLLSLRDLAGPPHPLLWRLGRRSIRFAIAAGLASSGLVLLLRLLMLLLRRLVLLLLLLLLLPLPLPLDGCQCLRRCE